jgi:hypothetical protein
MTLKITVLAELLDDLSSRLAEIEARLEVLEAPKQCFTCATDDL